MKNRAQKMHLRSAINIFERELNEFQLIIVLIDYDFFNLWKLLQLLVTIYVWKFINFEKL